MYEVTLSFLVLDVDPEVGQRANMELIATLLEGNITFIQKDNLAFSPIAVNISAVDSDEANPLREKYDFTIGPYPSGNKGSLRRFFTKHTQVMRYLVAKLPGR